MKYVRKDTRFLWSTESMEAAVNAVCNDSMPYREAARSFNVPRNTLKRHVAKRKEKPDYVVVKQLGPIQGVFTPEQEQELVEYLIQLEARYFGFTLQELKEMAFQLAEKNKIKHPFKGNAAGKDWALGFMERHPQLSLRKPEATSVARAMGFNKVAVDQFFTLLGSVLDEYKLTPDRIYNCDETGISVNPKSFSKVISQKGRKQVGIATSQERGEMITAIICMSASGMFVPPTLIFPRKRMQQSFQLGLPPTSDVTLSDSGWVSKEIFVEWFKKFVKFSRATKNNPALLAMDGHSSHTKNLKLLEIARDNGVILLCLPPHCSHKLQPLDVSFMGPLSSYYSDENKKYLRMNPGKVVTLHQISTLFGSAYVKAATMRTAISGFAKTGIWPPDRNIFTDDDFLAADTTDIPLSSCENENPTTNLTDQITPNEVARNSNGLQSESAEQSQVNVLQNTTSSDENLPSSSKQDTSSSRISSNFDQFSPANVMPIPKVKNTVKRSNRKRGKAALLTDDSNYNELVIAELNKGKNPVKTANKKNKKTTENPKKKVSEVDKKVSKKTGKKKVKLEENDDCVFCHDYSAGGWIRCSSCFKWTHNSCAGVESDEEYYEYSCNLCMFN